MLVTWSHFITLHPFPENFTIGKVRWLNASIKQLLCPELSNMHVQGPMSLETRTYTGNNNSHLQLRKFR